jgi:phosphate transport system substrate-binding protein
MKKLIATLLAVVGLSVSAQTISGAGATFPAPLYSKWADAFNKETGIRINYQSVGSGAGITQVEKRTVVFGASDMPLTDDRLKSMNAIQFPTVIGGVVPVVNLKNVKPGELKLTGAVLAEIYLGKIKTWDDQAIKALNPSLMLPSVEILPVRRADGSGTTFLWTNYLSKVSPEFKSTVGEGTTVNWKVGVGGKGNEGVAQMVRQLPGAIGYVEYAYVKQTNMNWAQVQNAAGSWAYPDDVTFKAAAAGADWNKTFYHILTNQPGKDSWPISGATFIIMPLQSSNPEYAQTAIKFFLWALKNGGKMAEELDYVPLPSAVVTKIQQEVSKVR